MIFLAGSDLASLLSKCVWAFHIFLCNRLYNNNAMYLVLQHISVFLSAVIRQIGNSTNRSLRIFSALFEWVKKKPCITFAWGLIHQSITKTIEVPSQGDQYWILKSVVIYIKHLLFFNVYQGLTSVYSCYVWVMYQLDLRKVWFRSVS